MKQTTAFVLAAMVYLWLYSFPTHSLPERMVIRLAKGEIGWADRAISFSPDSAMLAVATSIGVYLYDPLTGEEIDFLEANDWLSCVAFSPDGSLLAGGSNDNTVKLWDVASRQLVDTLTEHTGFVTSIAFSPDGSLLASGGNDGMVKLWDVASHQLVDTLPGPSRWGVSSVAFNPDGNLLANGSSHDIVRLWDVSSHQLVDILTLRLLRAVHSVAFSPDGSLLASGIGYEVRLWDVASRHLVVALTGHGGVVSSVAFSPDGGLLASGSWDNTVKLWDVACCQLVDTLTGHTGLVTSVAFSPDGSLLASGSYDGTIVLWFIELSPQVHMEQGWNLISLPLKPLDAHPASVLASINTKYNSVWAYDPYTGWSVYVPGVPSNLLEMRPGRGYWVEMDQDQSEILTFEGTVPVSTDVPLWGEKWNLVGYNSLKIRRAEDCMSSVAGSINSVWGYNPTTGWSVYAPAGVSNLIFMKPGCGYWIKADETCTWNVNAPPQ